MCQATHDGIEVEAGDVADAEELAAESFASAVLSDDVDEITCECTRE